MTPGFAAGRGLAADTAVGLADDELAIWYTVSAAGSLINPWLGPVANSAADPLWADHAALGANSSDLLTDWSDRLSDELVPQVPDGLLNVLADASLAARA